jgi:hypothetical protein
MAAEKEDWLVDLLVEWLVEWLVGWLVGWMDDKKKKDENTRCEKERQDETDSYDGYNFPIFEFIYIKVFKHDN